MALSAGPASTRLPAPGSRRRCGAQAAAACDWPAGVVSHSHGDPGQMAAVRQLEHSPPGHWLAGVADAGRTCRMYVDRPRLASQQPARGSAVPAVQTQAMDAGAGAANPASSVQRQASAAQTGLDGRLVSGDRESGQGRKGSLCNRHSHPATRKKKHSAGRTVLMIDRQTASPAVRNPRSWPPLPWRAHRHTATLVTCRPQPAHLLLARGTSPSYMPSGSRRGPAREFGRGIP